VDSSATFLDVSLTDEPVGESDTYNPPLTMVESHGGVLVACVVSYFFLS